MIIKQILFFDHHIIRENQRHPCHQRSFETTFFFFAKFLLVIRSINTL
jgi:hypothetical protein